MNLAEFIIHIESFNANVNVSLIRKAYEFSDRVHAGQKRYSGEPYIEHCLEVAFVLAEQHLDSATIAAGILHDVVEDTATSVDDLRREFGDEIAELVDGVTKIGMVHYSSREEQQADYFRKMLLSMARDIRVILIKLADRLHNMRTLDHMKFDRQKTISQETRDVYCPLAHRFGINKIKIELEDHCFKYLEPDVYKDLSERLQQSREERDAYVEQLVNPIRDSLSRDGIRANVYGRAKHLDSIYRKIRVRKVPFEQIYDFFAIRIIVNTERECYHALGILHSMWKPVGDRFHDYIATPKQNGYRSLHTTVLGPQNKMVEVQIRTQQMHHVAENGIAAHWLYKEGKQLMSKSDRQMIWLRDVLEWQRDMTNPAEFLEYLKIDLYSEDIFVLTPNGRLIHLPRGSTPLDFAFHIHSDIGIHCAGAKINGRLMPLSTALNSGDTVEIVTNPNRAPSHDWLKLVHTSTARAKIRKWLNLAGFEQSVELGREILQRKLREVHADMPSLDDLQDIAEKLNKKSTEDLFAGLGNGSITAFSVMNLISPEAPPEPKTGIVSSVMKKIRGSKGIQIHGMDNMMFRFAGCCQPVPGEDVVGFITRGRGVSVHRADCATATSLAAEHPERRIDVTWDTGKGQSFVVELEIFVEDRKNMLRDITEAIADTDTNVRGAEMHSRGGGGSGRFVIEVSSLSHLNRTIEKVKKVKGVLSVIRSKRKEGID